MNSVGDNTRGLAGGGVGNLNQGAAGTSGHSGHHDGPHVSAVTPAEDVRSVLLNKISWSAVLAGTVVALVVQLLVNMLGIGIGAATIDPLSAGATPSASSFSIGAAIWWIVSGILAALAGGYAAGRLSGRPVRSTAAWHGLTTWAFTTLVIVYLLSSSVGGLMGGAANTVTGAIGGLGKTAGGAAQTAVSAAIPSLSSATDPFGSIEGQLRNASGNQDPAALRDTAVQAVRSALTGDPAQQQQARDKAADALAKAQNIPADQAKQQIQQYEQQYRQAVDQAKQKATEAADTSAKVVSRAAIFGFVALVLGALAGWFGGRMGTIDPTITDPGMPGAGAYVA